MKVTQWNESYARGENAIFYPHEEVVRFLNRFIRKRIDSHRFSDVIYRGDFYRSGIGITQGDKLIEAVGGGDNALYPIKALDFGCGIGRQSMLMSEFGIETCGIDISEYAISQAKHLAQNANLDIDFRVYDGEHIPFKHNTFDFTISYGVLDSLPFDLAQNLVSQIAYVSKTYFFCSLIGEDSTSGFSNIQESTFTDEIEVQESHEKGTIQSFFDYPKIQRLFKKSTFEIIWGEKKSSVNLIDGSIQSRYYIVCKKAEYEQ